MADQPLDTQFSVTFGDDFSFISNHGTVELRKGTVGDGNLYGTFEPADPQTTNKLETGSDYYFTGINGDPQVEVW